jgi:hypothetical protein
VSATVTPLRPTAPPPTLAELVDALATSTEAIALFAEECAERKQPLPLCLGLALELNRRLLERMTVR